MAAAFSHCQEAHRLHERGEVVKREVGDVPKHNQALEVVLLHWLSVTLHEVHCLRSRGRDTHQLVQGQLAQ